jgi:hypothetical protein
MVASLVIGGVLSVLGVVLVLGGIRRGVRAYSVSQTATTPLRSIPSADGPVAFDGEVRGHPESGAFDAPFSGEPAVYCEVWLAVHDRYRTDVEGLEVGNDDRPATNDAMESSWGLAEHDAIRSEFVVADGGARVAVDPTDAAVDIYGHMGERVLRLDEGEALSGDAKDRLERLAERSDAFDAAVETWDREDARVQYREARIAPGDTVHVADAVVTDTPEAWGADVDATVGAADGNDFLLSDGTEGEVLKQNATQFVTGIVVGGVVLALGLYILGALPGV